MRRTSTPAGVDCGSSCTAEVVSKAVVTLIAPEGTEAHGEAAIRSRLAGLIQSRGEVAIELAGVLSAGDIAHERWIIRSEGGEGFAHAPHPTLLLRRLGAEWKLAIVSPWGWSPTPPLEAVAAPR